MNQLNIFGGPVLSSNTPLRYPGGKTKMWKRFAKLLSERFNNIDTLVSPFCGAASIEIKCAANNIKVIAGDNLEPLINFWHYYQKDSQALVDQALQWYPLSYEEGLTFFHNELKENCQNLHGNTLTNFDRAAIFFLINRQTFRAYTLNQGPQKRTPEGLTSSSQLQKFREWYNTNITFVYSDYRKLIDHYEGHCMFFDPPYVDREYIYGTKNMDKSFDHKALRDKIVNLNNQWILCYVKHDLIMDLYQDFEIIEHEYTHTLNRTGRTEVKELFIINY